MHAPCNGRRRPRAAKVWHTQAACISFGFELAQMLKLGYWECGHVQASGDSMPGHGVELCFSVAMHACVDETRQEDSTLAVNFYSSGWRLGDDAAIFYKKCGWFSYALSVEDSDVLECKLGTGRG